MQQFLVTTKQYKFLFDYYVSIGIYPNNILMPKEIFDMGFELCFKGIGISPDHKEGLDIIDLRNLGNDLSKWIRRFYESTKGN